MYLNQIQIYSSYIAIRHYDNVDVHYFLSKKEGLTHTSADVMVGSRDLRVGFCLRIRKLIFVIISKYTVVQYFPQPLYYSVLVLFCFL